MIFQIFDSMDRPCTARTMHEHELHHALMVLREEAEEDNTGLTYAIGKVLPDDSVTFEY